MAFGADNLDSVAKKIEVYLKPDAPKNWKESLNIAEKIVEIAKCFPRKFKGKKARCQEIVYKGDEVDLSILPVLTCWPKDAGPFITLPLVITKSLKTGKRNVGMYRLQVFDKKSTGMHWHIHKDGSHYYNEYREAKKRMPVAVAIGASPAVTYAATAPMPTGIDEMILAGFIRGKTVLMTKCLTIDMEVPEEAEFVLEGYVEPDELRREGPFGDHTGYYSLADDYPVFHVTAITHKKNAIYNATLVGRPPMEDCFLAKATERFFLPMIKAIMPEIKDYHFPMEGVFHNIVIVSIFKEYSGHAYKVINGLWGQGQMSFCKAIVVVDKDIDPSDTKLVLDELLAKFDPKSDVVITKGVLDVLDHSSPHKNFGTKIGIDLTERFLGEPPRNSYCVKKETVPDNLKPLLLSEISEITDCALFFSKILVINIEKSDKKGGKIFASELLNLENIHMIDYIILFDKEINTNDYSLMLWKLFNNVDPARDVVISENRIVIDACRKGPADGHSREWPDELIF